MEQNSIYFPDEESSFLRFLKRVGIVLLVLGVVYAIIAVSVRKEKLYDDTVIKNQIDSLAKVNQELQSKQAYYDSLNNVYQSNIADLDYRINNIKQTRTVVKKYYTNNSNAVRGYTNSQVDSFFRKRYNY